MDEKIVSDESECDYWSCNNTYTQCNGYWLCKNGADEVHCLSSDCPLFHHPCIFLNDTSKLSCLPIDRAGDGIIDYLGGTDELYQEELYDVFFGSEGSYFVNLFQCQNDSKRILLDYICDSVSNCPLSDDEIICTNYPNPGYLSICDEPFQYIRTIREDFFCKLFMAIGNPALSPKFLLKNMPTYSIQTIDDIKLSTNSNTIKTQLIQKQTSTIVHENSKDGWCNLGLPIHVRNTSDIYCLCPPSSYGDQCEYENERVSLTFQLSFSSDWKNFFLFLVTLIDNERNIESYDLIDYSSIIHCDMKFNIYLLYSTRPKTRSKTYSIQIDALHKRSFDYRSSWIYPIKYSFLPVYRLSVFLKVPMMDAKIDSRCNPSCIHGRCFSYVNDPNSTYCHCDSGWSGIRCNIGLNCRCAPDSFCLSNSICLCPFDRYGRRCYLNYSSCYPNPCLNDGQCISSDLRLRNSNTSIFRCVCPFGYSGRHCEQKENRNRIEIPSALLIHFVNIYNRFYTLLARTSFNEKNSN